MKFFPKLLDFLKNVTNDERIPAHDKKILAALVALIISPVDLIPDWIPVIGWIDDWIILALVLDYFFNVLDSEVLLSHYPWGMKSFLRLKRWSSLISWSAPNWLKSRIWNYVGSPYHH